MNDFKNKWLIFAIIIIAIAVWYFGIAQPVGTQASFNWDSAAANTQSWWSSLSPMTKNIVYAVLGIMVVVQFFYKKN